MLIINDTHVNVDSPWQEASLLELLRDNLGLVGTKYGCGIGQCGACTVHVNGNPVRSCLVKVADLQGQKVTTIEGLQDKGQLHPVQKSWLKHNVAQCGYCQAGQLMTAAAFIDSSTGVPTLEQARKVMAHNLCRCGSYNRIAAAVVDAAQIDAAQIDVVQVDGLGSQVSEVKSV